MSDKTAKEIRKQIRNVVQEILPEILKAEYTAAIKAQLSEELGKRMDVIAKGARETLDGIESKQSDFHNYMIKSLSQQQPLQDLAPVSTELKEEVAAAAEIKQD